MKKAIRRQASERSVHGTQAPEMKGPKPESADGVIILLHGRGSSAGNMIALYEELDVKGFGAIALPASGGTWYPNSFLAPIETNQPNLDSALGVIEEVVLDLESRGVPSERIALLGFSQGACLALEFVARHPRRYGAVIGLTGGLIGPEGTKRNYPGSLKGTPVFIGTSDPDPHVPLKRVEESGVVLEKMGAKVEIRRYAGMAHTINEDEIEVCRALLMTIGNAGEE